MSEQEAQMESAAEVVHYLPTWEDVHEAAWKGRSAVGFRECAALVNAQVSEYLASTREHQVAELCDIVSVVRNRLRTLGVPSLELAMRARMRVRMSAEQTEGIREKYAWCRPVDDPEPRV